jgi:hypothetical protein
MKIEQLKKIIKELNSELCNLRKAKVDSDFLKIESIENKILVVIHSLLLDIDLKEYNYKLDLLNCIMTTITEFQESEDFETLLIFRICKFAA